jgi:hypothetical protein
MPVGRTALHCSWGSTYRNLALHVGGGSQNWRVKYGHESHRTPWDRLHWWGPAATTNYRPLLTERAPHIKKIQVFKDNFQWWERKIGHESKMVSWYHDRLADCQLYDNFDFDSQSGRRSLCASRYKYLHQRPVSPRKWQKGSPVCGDII